MNLNSLNKIHLLSNFLSSSNVWFCCICKTWLNSDISNVVVNLPGYSFFRNDSPFNIKICGVGIYVQNDIKVGKISGDHPNTIGVFLPDFNLVVLVIYRPPSYSLTDNLALISYIQAFCKDTELILVGDFKLPSIDWSSEIPCAISAVDINFPDLFTSLGLSQWVKQPTFLCSDHILDLIFTTEHDRISNLTLLDPLPGCDHFPIIFDYLFCSSASSVSSDYSDLNFSTFIRLITILLFCTLQILIGTQSFLDCALRKLILLSYLYFIILFWNSFP